MIAALSAVSLWTPGGPLEPMWRVNPRAREAFETIGTAAPFLLSAVSIGCAAAAYGLWRVRPWGAPCALVLIGLQLAGGLVNVALGIELRALFGLPIAALLLLYLWRHRRAASGGNPSVSGSGSSRRPDRDRSSAGSRDSSS